MMNFELCHKMKRIEASYSWYSYGLRLSSLIIPLLCRTRIFLSLYDSEVEEECDVGLNRHLVCLRNIDSIENLAHQYFAKIMFSRKSLLGISLVFM